MSITTDEKPSTLRNQSTDKALRLIEFLADRGQPMRLKDISAGLSLNPSTTLRFLTSLIESGYVAQDIETSQYYLTYKIVAIGQKVKESNQASRIISPYLKTICENVHETICLAIERNNQVVYLDVAEGPAQIIKAMTRIGNIAPLHCTGIGKLFLLNYTEAQIDSIILSKGLQRFTQYTITTKEALLNELAEVKNNGYALDREECELGACCIAFPIYDYTGKIIAGISVTGPSIRITPEFTAKWIPYLRNITSTISRQFGWGKYL